MQLRHTAHCGDRNTLIIGRRRRHSPRMRAAADAAGIRVAAPNPAAANGNRRQRSGAGADMISSAICNWRIPIIIAETSIAGRQIICCGSRATTIPLDFVPDINHELRNECQCSQRGTTGTEPRRQSPAARSVSRRPLSIHQCVVHLPGAGFLRPDHHLACRLGAWSKWALMRAPAPAI